MKDKWINVGYEADELKPHIEPEEDFGDTNRIGEKRTLQYLIYLIMDHKIIRLIDCSRGKEKYLLK